MRFSNATLPDGSRCDIEVEGGRIASLLPASPATPDAVDLAGTLVLPPLVDAPPPAAADGARRALVVGQPLTGFGLMSAADLAVTTARIRDWLTAQGITDIDYKAHPKDAAHELKHADYRLIEPDCALEMHMARTPYAAVVGVRSTALLIARQIYAPEVLVAAIGWSSVRFKSRKEADDMRKVFEICRVTIE